MIVQAPGYSQQNSIPHSHQMPSLGNLGSSFYMDPDLYLARRRIQHKIFQLFLKKYMSPEMRQKLPDIVRRLEERLLRDASSKEEYMNEVTLERRLQNIVRRTNASNHLQRQQTAHHMNSSSDMGTMIPPPGVSQSAHVTVPTLGDNYVTNMSMVTPSTLNPGYSLPATNGYSSVHGGFYNVSEVLQQPMNPLSGDIYRTNNGNMSASEGLYGSAISVGSTLNSQILSHHQQAVPTRTRVVDASVKTNFKISHLNRGHISQSQEQMQQSHEQKIQQQPYSQFMQHQTQKQHNQQHPLLVKNYNTPGQSQLLSPVDSQDMTDYGTKSSRNSLQSHMPEQCQITKLQNKYQMQNASLEDQTKGARLLNGSSNLQEFHSPFPPIPNQMQLQQIMHHCQQTVESQNTSSEFSSRSQANILLPGQRKSQSAERFRQIYQNVEEKIHQRIRDAEAQKPLFLLEGEAVTSFREATNQNVASVANEKCDKDCRNQKRWLLFLCHARSCPYPEGGCPEAHCSFVRKLCLHMKECEDENCLYPHCCKSRKLIYHFRMCMSANCPVCIPVRQYLSCHHKVRISVPTNNTPTHQNGAWKSVDARDVSKVQLKNDMSSSGAFEDMQPSAKCMEVDQSHSSFAPMTEKLSASVDPAKAPYSMEAQPHIGKKLEAYVEDVQPAAKRIKVDHSFPSLPPNEKPSASVGPVKALYSMEERPPPVEDVQHAAKRMKSDHSYPSFTSMTEKPSARVGPVTAPYIIEAQSHIGRKPETPVLKFVPFESKAKHVSANFGQVKSPKLSEAKNNNLEVVHAEKPSMDCIIQNELSKCDNVAMEKAIDQLKQKLPQEQSTVLPIDPLSTLKSGKPSMDRVIQNEFSKCDNVVINKEIDQLKQELPQEKSMNLSIDSLSTLKSGKPFMDCIIQNCDIVVINKEIDLLKQELPQENYTALLTDPISTSKSGKPFMDHIVQSELPKCDNVVVNKEIDQLKQELPQEKSTALPTNPLSTLKSGKSKIKGVALTELFTPEQVREHRRSLKQWVGQSKAKAERNQAMSVTENENSCQLCGVENLPFEPPPIYCSPCGARVKRNAIYYTTGTAEARYYFCRLCYNKARGDTIEAEGLNISKAKLEKKKNDEVTYEAWVQCDGCENWQHQVCALFNGRRNDGGKAEYTCPCCYVREIEKGERKPLPQNAVLCAKDLPRTLLSDHIEQRLERRLKQEREERARMQGKLFEEVPGAETLVVRVVSSVDKKLEVKQRFLEIFREENYPTEFPYKSKVVLLFQKIEGVEVCLFGMFVQEFGSECQFPNQRRVYLSYLDSVKYFRPDIKTVTGEALRTFVYHEILIGYLEYCKKRGFTSCYIWACTPLKGEDYILYCHPEIQKTPKSDKLREWYLSMLRKASKESIAVDLTNLYDHFFVTIGECKAKVTAARLPYFDGDYWPGAAEDMINQLCQEDDGRKQIKKFKKIITKRALKASGHTDLSANASKDALLMQKLGETICPMKEDFIMVHLQHACTRCCHFMVSGKRWVCFQCKNFQLCDECYIIEQKLEDRERHPSKSKEKHKLNPIEIEDVPIETKDKDGILESEFFDTRQAFLGLCQGNHYQYETLRRAKHSSMMVLYHLHNPTAPAFVTQCNLCQHDIEDGQGWRCEVCPAFDVCDSCYRKDKGIDHPHKLTNYPSMAERDAQNKEARQLRFQQLRRMLELLVHATQCRAQCKYPNCCQVKCLFQHGMLCTKRAGGGCLLCKKMWYLLQVHARTCKVPGCRVPRCKDLKEHMRRMQHQSESRRRAAVNEMMRERAAEVAGNS